MFTYVVILAVSFAVLVPTCCKADNNETSRRYHVRLPEGHPQNCKFLTENNGTDMRVLGVLPGVGWDNLRNVFMGMVMKYEYKQCRLTEDEQYLIPDGMYTIPIKQSKVDNSVDVFQHWSEYESAKSASINADASFRKLGVSVSGSFSLEVQANKRRQSKKGIITTRVQLRHRIYNVLLRSVGTALTDEFKVRVMEIGNTLNDGDNVMAAYLSDEMVRDFGTHVLTRVEAGAAIIQEFQMENTNRDTSDAHMAEIKSSASANFLGGRFRVSVSAGANIQEGSRSRMDIETVDNHIESYGGPVLRSSMSISDWEDGIHNNLVALDEAGEPLHTFVTSALIKDMPKFLTYQVSVEIENAVYRYYAMNTIKGCLDSENNNFNFLANTNQADLCDPPEQESGYMIGGAYTTCWPESSTMCDKEVRNNPFTGWVNCQGDFDQYFISRQTISKSYDVPSMKRECTSKGWFRRSCMDVMTVERKTDYAEIASFWCGKRIDKDTEYYFGGMYTLPNVPNPVTKSTDCPEYFIALSLGYGVRVCVSKDTRAHTLASSIEFGGVFTCNVANPFAANATTRYSRDDETLKKCPHGFSPYTATIMDSTCLFSYCLRSKNGSNSGDRILLGTTQLPIRPPYANRPQPSANRTNTMAYMDYSVGEMWLKNRSTDGWNKYAFGDETPNVPDYLSDTSAAVSDSYASTATVKSQYLSTLIYLLTFSFLTLVQ
ncbi:macrophage-expressed gene 1 protein-like [Antedon mediterranea]|uniref:macrophage-expressed gene 1 protein-like n=1 Tax=Antedon mediterranea TaxID=105859 RepID=UPI003AF56513